MRIPRGAYAALVAIPLGACASGSRIPPEFAHAIVSDEADQPARLVECPGYAPLSTPGTGLAVWIDVVVDEAGVVRHATTAPVRTGTSHEVARQESGVDGWQELRSDALRLAEGCQFEPAVDQGSPVAVRSSLEFEFPRDPTNAVVRAVECPPAGSGRPRPARCGG